MGVLPDWMIKTQVKIEPFDDGKMNVGRLSSGLTSYGYDARVGYKFKIFSPINATVIDPKAFDPKSLVEVDLTPTTKHKWKLCNDFRECVNCGSQNLYGDLSEFKRWMREVCPKCPDSHILIPPNSFALAETVEYFEIPRDCLAFVVGKSTYARCGIIVPVTPLEPEWRGKVTVEIANTTCLPAKVYCGEGIMQIVFLRSDGDTQNIRELIRSFATGLIETGNRDWHVCQEAADLLRRLSIIENPTDRNGTCNTSYADKKGKYMDQTGLEHPKVEVK